MKYIPNPVLASVSIPQFGAIFAGTTYLLGYLVSNIFCRSVGIENTELFRAAYIETGAVFVLIAITMGVYPISLLRFLIERRRASGLPRIYVPLQVIVYVNWAVLITLFAFFAGSDDWSTRVYLPPFERFSFGSLFGSYIVAVVAWGATTIIVSTQLKRFWHRIVDAVRGVQRANSNPENISRQDPEMHGVWMALTCPLLIAASVWLDFAFFKTFSWSSALPIDLAGSAAFALLLYFILMRSAIAFATLATIQQRISLFLMSGIMALLLLYLLLQSYALLVYPQIPVSRGGRLPENVVRLELTDKVGKAVSNTRAKNGQGKKAPVEQPASESILLYVLHQDDKRIIGFREECYGAKTRPRTYGPLISLNADGYHIKQMERRNIRESRSQEKSVNCQVEELQQGGIEQKPY